MKRILSLVLVLVLFAAITPALADNGNTILNNIGMSIITLTPDEWQGNEDYFLVEVHTGINTTTDFLLKIPTGFVGITDCLVLDNIEEGHLVAYPAGEVTIKVKNGFVGLCRAAVAEELFTERWHVLRDNNWARKDVRPLLTWNWIAD